MNRSPLLGIRVIAALIVLGSLVWFGQRGFASQETDRDEVWKTYLDKGPEEALRNLDRRFPQSKPPWAFRDHVVLLLELGRARKAVGELEDTAPFGPSLTARLRWEAVVAHHASLSESRPMADLLHRDSEWHWGWFLAGELAERGGTSGTNEALVDFGKAATGSSSAMAHREKGWVLASLGRPANAAEEYQAALNADGSLVEVRRLLAEARAAVGDQKRAAAEFQKLLHVRPDDAVARKRLNEVAPNYEEQREVTKMREREIHPNQELARLTFPVECPRIRVGLAVGVHRLRFRVGEAFRAMGASGERQVLGKAGEEWTVEAGTEGGVRLRSTDADLPLRAPVRIEPMTERSTFRIYDVHFGEGYFFAGEEDREFRGSLVLERKPGGLITVVNDVHVEEYLYGVLPSEMPPSWPHEALKAQAIAARSETLRKLGRHKAQGFDVCSEVHCASYRGVLGEDRRSSAAVDATRGRVLMVGPRVADAVYHSHCGGRTQDASDVWAGTSDEGLVGSPDGNFDDFSGPADLFLFCRDAPPGSCASGGYSGGSEARWIRLLTPEEVQRNLREAHHGDLGEIRSIEVVERGRGGVVKVLEVKGTGGTIKVPGSSVRRVLGGLRSNLFVLEPWNSPSGAPEAFCVFGAGWGHGVGMCQSGAAVRAAHGETAEEILAHYYAGARLATLRDAGLCP